MEIIRCAPREAEELRQVILTAKQHWGYPESMMTEWAARLKFPPEYVRRNQVWGAVIDGKTAGFYGLVINGDVAVLDHLWIVPEHIGTGVGRRLFHHAMKRAKEYGCARLELEADRHAAGFYERMGARQLRTVETALEGTLPIMGMDLLPSDRADLPIVPVCYVLVVDDRTEQVLMVLNEVYWTPPGGAVEPGETLKQAAVREAKEETGLDVEIGELLHVSEKFFSGRNHALFFTFQARIIGGEVKTGIDSEVQGVEWKSIAEAERLMPWYGDLRSLLRHKATYLVE